MGVSILERKGYHPHNIVGKQFIHDKNGKLTVSHVGGIKAGKKSAFTKRQQRLGFHTEYIYAGNGIYQPWIRPVPGRQSALNAAIHAPLLTYNRKRGRRKKWINRLKR